jgi:hypothetical protein
VEVFVPDRGRQTRVDGEQVARWNPSSSPAGSGSRCHTHLREAYISGGRNVENGSGWSLNSRRGLQRTLQRLLTPVGPKGLLFHTLVLIEFVSGSVPGCNGVLRSLLFFG